MLLDLNCDMGESFGAYTLGMDETAALLVSSLNVACGFHAGDPRVMRKTISLAAQHHIAVGAHPGFADLAGFGRRELAASPQEVCDDILYQLGALDAFMRAEGLTMQHVKPHGALYNMAAKDAALAEAICRAICQFDKNLILLAQSGSQMELAAQKAGLPFACEVFADRAYLADGRLAPRSMPGSVLHDPDKAALRAVQMVTQGTVQAITGETIPLKVHSICVHGDNPQAVQMIERLREALLAADVQIASLREVLA